MFAGTERVNQKAISDYVAKNPGVDRAQAALALNLV
jgi:hypothetical protein